MSSFILSPSTLERAQQTILNKTVDYPETLTKTINSIQASLPVSDPEAPSALKRVQDTVSSQENLVRSMASVLVNLVGHYENMANTLKESESGVVYTDEELVGKFACFGQLRYRY